jgi:hypothetical protein
MLISRMSTDAATTTANGPLPRLVRMPTFKKEENQKAKVKKET